VILNLVDWCGFENPVDKLFGLFAALFVHTLRLFFALSLKNAPVDKLYPFTSHTLGVVVVG